MFSDNPSMLEGLLFAILIPAACYGGFALVCAAVALLWRRLFVRPIERDNARASFLRGLMKRMEKPTLLLVPSKEPVFTKLGGNPELSADIAWPQGEKEPPAFLAQIDLGEVRAAGGPEWLPAAGRIYAFMNDDRWGLRDQVRIAHTTGPSGSATLPPPDLSPTLRFQERRCAFLPMTSTPSLDWVGVDLTGLKIDDEKFDALADAPNAPFGDELQHRIGGYPSEIQGSQMQLECEWIARGLEPTYDEPPSPAIKRASRQWRLLLQLDSDPALGMNWGDGGMLYVFIRERHARTADFSQTVTISQTY